MESVDSSPRHAVPAESHQAELQRPCKSCEKAVEIQMTHLEYPQELEPSQVQALSRVYLSIGPLLNLLALEVVYRRLLCA